MVIQVLGMIFYPLVVHLLIEFGATWLAVLGLILTSILYMLLMLNVRRMSTSNGYWIVLYLVLGGIGSLNLLTDTHYALFVPPVAINLAVGFFFSTSLRSGSVPLVERMMRFEYAGKAPPGPVAHYARALTWVWAIYFPVAAIVCLVLAVVAPIHVWSLFANVLNYVIAIGLVFAQYLFRAWRLRQYGFVMPWHTIRGMVRNPEALWPAPMTSPNRSEPQ